MNYFDPAGPVISVLASTQAPNGTQALSKNNVATPQVMVSNPNTVLGVVIGWGPTTTIAAQAAASTTSPNQYYLAPSSQKLIVGAPDAFYSGVTTTLTATIFIQPGIEG